MESDHKNSKIYNPLGTIPIAKAHLFVPEASIPREIKKPLTWQKSEPVGIGPCAKVTIGYIMNQSALNMSL
jgi:hypothetical protein